MRQKMPKSTLVVGPIAMAALAQIASAAVVTNDAATVSYDFEQFDARGFAPSPQSTQLDSDDVIYRRNATSGEKFGDTLTDYPYGQGLVPSGGNPTAGGIWALDLKQAGVRDRMLLIQPTVNDFTSGALVFKFTNAGTTSITGVAVAGVLYVNNNENRASAFNLTLTASGNTQTLNSYASLESRDANGFVLESGAASGSATGLTIAPGEDFFIEYRGGNVSGGGSYDEFALGSVSMTATFAAVAVPEPLAALAGMALLGVVTSRRVRMA